MKIVVLDQGTFADGTAEARPSFPHEWAAYAQTAPEQVLERLAGAQVAINNKVPLRRETLEQLPELKMISVAATGYDVIDLEACKERGITVSNVRGYAGVTVPEHAFALILALRRQIVGYRQDVIDGAWQRKPGSSAFHAHPMRDLSGATLGDLRRGCARPRPCAKLGQAFGMRTLFAAHKGVEGLGPLYTPFEQVLAESDVISLHCPLTPATRNMIAAPEFAQMKRKPLIVNTSRGGLVHEGDLVAALDQRADLRHRLRRADDGASGAGQSAAFGARPTERHRHAACRLGQPAKRRWNAGVRPIGAIEDFVAGAPSNVVVVRRPEASEVSARGGHE